MLGRYVTGTVLILGAAMAIAPDGDDAPEPQVTRGDAAPAALSTPAPIPVTSPNADPGPATVTTLRLTDPTPALAAPQRVEPKANPDLIEAAIMEANGIAVPPPQQDTVPGIASLAGLDTAGSAPSVLTVTGSRVNVRSGPSTQFTVIGSVVRGDEVELVAYRNNGWAEIRFVDTGEIGFMSGQFLSE